MATRPDVPRWVPRGAGPAALAVLLAGLGVGLGLTWPSGHASAAPSGDHLAAAPAATPAAAVAPQPTPAAPAPDVTLASVAGASAALEPAVLGSPASAPRDADRIRGPPGGRQA
jgi:hypothetical protein